MSLNNCLTTKFLASVLTVKDRGYDDDFWDMSRHACPLVSRLAAEEIVDVVVG